MIIIFVYYRLSNATIHIKLTDDSNIQCQYSNTVNGSIMWKLKYMYSGL